MTEPDHTPDELPLGRPPSLDPIGREIARMKIGDALFAKREDAPVVEPAITHAPKPWRAIVLIAAVVAIVAFVLLR